MTMTTSTTMEKHPWGKIHVQLGNKKQMSLPRMALFFAGGGGEVSPMDAVGSLLQQWCKAVSRSGGIGGEAGKASLMGAVGLSSQQQHKATPTSGGIILRSPEDKDMKRRKIQQHGTKGIDGVGNRKTTKG
jgi:hypothetical protein